MNIHLVRYSFAKTNIFCDAEEPCAKCSRVVAIVPYSTIGLSLVSEAPARLRFEYFLVLLNDQHFELEAFSVVIVARCNGVG